MKVAVHYRFSACECLGSAGVVLKIPTGIWPVAEREPVSALVDGRVLALDAAAFEQLKLEGKVQLLG